MIGNEPSKELPRVCVVIPTRDRHESLRQALASVLQQGEAGFEVVVIDEASSPPVAEALGVLPERVRIIRNDSPQGPAAARNRGAKATQADLIAFLDDDDRWLPEKLEATLACFDRHQEAGMVFHRTVPHGGPMEGSGRCRMLQNPVFRMLKRQPPHLDSVVLRRAVHERVLFDESFAAAAELDYLIRVAASTPVVELDRVLAVHGPPGESRSYIGLEARIQARRQLRAKHAQWFSDGDVRAFYYVRLGHLHRRAGHRLRAAGCFVRALASRPASGLAWRGFAASFLPRRILDRS